MQQRGVPYWFRIPFLPLLLEYLTSSPLYILRGSDLGRDGGAISQTKRTEGSRSQTGREGEGNRDDLLKVDLSPGLQLLMPIVCHREESPSMYGTQRMG